MRKLVLFDFDGTITHKDTLFEIAKFSSFALIYYVKLLLLSPVFVLAIFRVISKQKTKEIFLSLFFKGISETDFNTFCEEFSERKLPSLIRKKAQDELLKLTHTDTDIYIVSASPENWIIPWANTFGIKVIGTRLDFKNDEFTGKLQEKNCNGKEKVNRIRKEINIANYQQIIAFGDTKGDLPMFQLAHESYYKPFR